jgi:hypothetical protein
MSMHPAPVLPGQSSHPPSRHASQIHQSDQNGRGKARSGRRPPGPRRRSSHQRCGYPVVTEELPNKPTNRPLESAIEGSRTCRADPCPSAIAIKRRPDGPRTGGLFGSRPARARCDADRPRYLAQGHPCDGPRPPDAPVVGDRPAAGPPGLLPGIWPSLHLDTTITVPVGVEAYAAYALRALAVRRAPGEHAHTPVREMVRDLLLRVRHGRQVAYHLLAQAGDPPQAPRTAWPSDRPQRGVFPATSAFCVRFASLWLGQR